MRSCTADNRADSVLISMKFPQPSWPAGILRLILLRDLPLQSVPMLIGCYTMVSELCTLYIRQLGFNAQGSPFSLLTLRRGKISPNIYQNYIYMIDSALQNR